MHRSYSSQPLYICTVSSYEDVCSMGFRSQPLPTAVPKTKCNGHTGWLQCETIGRDQCQVEHHILGIITCDDNSYAVRILDSPFRSRWSGLFVSVKVYIARRDATPIWCPKRKDQTLFYSISNKPIHIERIWKKLALHYQHQHPINIGYQDYGSSVHR